MAKRFASNVAFNTHHMNALQDEIDGLLQTDGSMEQVLTTVVANAMIEHNDIIDIYDVFPMDYNNLVAFPILPKNSYFIVNNGSIDGLYFSTTNSIVIGDTIDVQLFSYHRYDSNMIWTIPSTMSSRFTYGLLSYSNLDGAETIKVYRMDPPATTS